MKLEVLGWARDFVLSLLSRAIEIIFRLTLFMLPLGLYLCLIQFRNKVSSISNLSVYTGEYSVWQHIFPGFILVAINPKEFKDRIDEVKASIQEHIERNKYILSLLFMSLFLLIMLLKR